MCVTTNKYMYALRLPTLSGCYQATYVAHTWHIVNLVRRLWWVWTKFAIRHCSKLQFYSRVMANHHLVSGSKSFHRNFCSDCSLFVLQHPGTLGHTVELNHNLQGCKTKDSCHLSHLLWLVVHLLLKHGSLCTLSNGSVTLGGSLWLRLKHACRSQHA